MLVSSTKAKVLRTGYQFGGSLLAIEDAGGGWRGGGGAS